MKVGTGVRVGSLSLLLLLPPLPLPPLPLRLRGGSVGCGRGGCSVGCG